MLVELSSRSVPLFFEKSIFKMKVRGVHPVLAHPERHQAFMQDTSALEPMLGVGVMPLLDVMALVGKYGSHPKRAAERMLEENVYVAACTDCHSPADVERAEQGIARLTELVGDEQAHVLLAVNPTRILEGRVEQ